MAPPAHGSPALRQPPAPDAGASWQIPSVAPFCLLHLPPQHSRSLVQASPAVVQYDGVEQNPLLQYFAQHSPADVHGLPDVLQPASGVHMPDEHLPPQHALSAVHASLSAVHCVFEHAPLTQAYVQQSVPPWQA